MTSSTSNSERSLIALSLTVFLALFVGYNVAVKIAKPEGLFLQNQAEKNISTAEDYIFEKKAADTVIVGSSLAARLDESYFGKGFRNLSFAGGTAATGLEIIRRHGTVPKVVLVETNLIRDLDTAFVEAQYQPLSLFLKRYLPSAQAKYRPVNLLLGGLRSKTGTESVVPDANVFANLLANQQSDYSRLPDQDWLRHSTGVLAREVDSLMARGVKVIFFVMPINAILEDSPKARNQLEEYQRVFPPSRYLWIDSLPGEYITADGIHLVPQSARTYAGLLRKRLESGPL